MLPALLYIRKNPTYFFFKMVFRFVYICLTLFSSDSSYKRLVFNHPGFFFLGVWGKDQYLSSHYNPIVANVSILDTFWDSFVFLMQRVLTWIGIVNNGVGIKTKVNIFYHLQYSCILFMVKTVNFLSELWDSTEKHSFFLSFEYRL